MVVMALDSSLVTNPMGVLSDKNRPKPSLFFLVY